ncbi:hypothetical protein Unana1_07498 [Umbelopsis nana]
MRSGHCAFATNTTLYIFGGRSTNNYQTISRFISIDIANSSDWQNAHWNVLNNSNSFNIVDGACAITGAGKALMLGYDADARASSPGIQVYDTVANNWTVASSQGLDVANTFGNRADMASAIANDKFILFGGSTAGSAANRTTFVLDTTTSPWNWSQIEPNQRTPSNVLGGSMVGIGRYAYHITVNSTSNNSSLIYAFDSKRLRWIGQVANFSIPAEMVMLAGGNLSTDVWMIPSEPRSSNNLQKRATWDTTMWLFSSDDHSLNNQTESNSTYTPRSGSTATLIGASTLAIFGGDTYDSNLLVYDLDQNQMVPQWSNVQIPTRAQPSAQPVPSQAPAATNPATNDNSDRNRILGIVLGTVIGGICVIVIGIFAVRHRQRRQKDKMVYSAPYTGDTRQDASLEKPAPDPSNMPKLNIVHAPAEDTPIPPTIPALTAVSASQKSLSRSLSATTHSAKAAIASRFTEHFGKENQSSVTPELAQGNDEPVSSHEELFLTEPRLPYGQPSTSDDGIDTSNDSSNNVPPFRRSWS